MSTGAVIGIIIGIVLIGLMAWGISTNNRIIRSRELVRNAMGQIAAQIESRWDGLSSLIEATKKYSEHEAELLMDITKSRSGIDKSSNISDVEKDTEIFEDAMGRLNIVVENYPELKASNIFEKTMSSIDKYEDNVRHSRMIYNDTVTKYNSSILVFPASIIAGIKNYTEKDYFENTGEKIDMPSWD